MWRDPFIPSSLLPDQARSSSGYKGRNKYIHLKQLLGCFRGEQKYSAIDIKGAKSLEVLLQDQQLTALVGEGSVPMYDC